MFGYVTICEPELKVKDLRKYKAYYCGLCQELKEAYGAVGQMTLTYDMTFVIVLLTSLYESQTELTEHRCKVNPVKKQKMLRNEISWRTTGLTKRASEACWEMVFCAREREK